MAEALAAVLAAEEALVTADMKVALAAVTDMVASHIKVAREVAVAVAGRVAVAVACQAHSHSGAFQCPTIGRKHQRLEVPNQR